MPASRSPDDTSWSPLAHAGAMLLASLCACQGDMGSPADGSATATDGSSADGGTGSETADSAGSDGGSDDGHADGGVDPGPIPEGSGRHEGILDCPTVDSPAYSRGVDASLSTPFAVSCGACHGASGEGAGNYPAIPGTLSVDEYIAVVRQGKGLMPAFGEDFVTDAQLEQDYASLQLLADGADQDLLPAGGEWTWTEDQVVDAYQRGLVAWRKPDKDGLACANCHSPDAVDLAVIGFTDDDILRRSGLHLPPEDAADLVDFVHAQRRRFDIAKTCSKDWRPLQPGGEVLPGDTPQEQDASFAQVLVDRDYRVATGAIATLDDAKAALSEMADIDLKRLPIGIALPRWAEDGFDGPEHNTINDYLLGVGRVPNDPEAWYALEDQYIQDPSNENMFEMVNRITAETNDLGFAEATEAEYSQTDGRCGPMNRAGMGFLPFVDEAKRRSGILVQHFMRMALRDEPGWYEQPDMPYVEYAHQYGEGLNPFFRLGAQLAEHNCRKAGPMLATWPEEQAEEIPASDLADGVAVELSRQLNHSWQSLGTLYDPTLLMQENFTKTQNLHYWALNGFEQRSVHLPFLYLHRILNQEQHYNELRGTDDHPPLNMNHFGSIEVHPLLDGKRMLYKTGNGGVAEDPTLAGRVANTVRCNAFRTLLLLQQELLEAGESGSHIYHSPNNTHTLNELYDTMSTWANRLGRQGDSEALLMDEFAGQADLCTSGLESLVAEVRATAQTVPDLGDQ